MNENFECGNENSLKKNENCDCGNENSSTMNEDSLRSNAKSYFCGSALGAIDLPLKVFELPAEDFLDNTKKFAPIAFDNPKWTMGTSGKKL